jgi:small subunit ribosomal protein S2
MAKVNFDQLLDAGVHFGHLKRKWNPKMAPYIFMERNGIHILDLHKTIAKIDEAAAAMKQIAKSGRKVLFVATKKQAKEIVSELVKTVGMPYVTERWPGGMLTNFATIRKAVKKMSTLDKMMTDKNYTDISKREKLQMSREKAKLEKNLGSIADLSRLPSALFIVDINKEHIAVAEARRLNIPTFAMVDTNTNPELVDFPIPSNDDASKSIAIIVGDEDAAAEAASIHSETLEAFEGVEDEEAAAKRKLAKKMKDEEEQVEAAKRPRRPVINKPATIKKTNTNI